MNHRLILATALCVASTACGVQVIGGGGGGTGGSEASTTDAGAGGATGTSTSAGGAAGTGGGLTDWPSSGAGGGDFMATYPPADCPVPEQGVAPTPTLLDFEKLLFGRWLICSKPSVFSTNEDGFEIRPDKKWYKLYQVSPGNFQRGQGLDERGVWEILDVSAPNQPGTFQLNLITDGAGEIYAFPVFAAEPRKMVLKSMNSGGEYVFQP